MFARWVKTVRLLFPTSSGWVRLLFPTSSGGDRGVAGGAVSLTFNAASPPHCEPPGVLRHEHPLHVHSPVEVPHAGLEPAPNTTQHKHGASQPPGPNACTSTPDCPPPTATTAMHTASANGPNCISLRFPFNGGGEDYTGWEEKTFEQLSLFHTL